MAETCREALRDCGVNPERLALEWASAAEGPRFVEIITGYVSRIRSLGPLGTGQGEAGKDVLARRLRAAVLAAEAVKVRTAFGNLAKRLHASGDYEAGSISAGVADKVLPAFRQERLNREIHLRLDQQGPADIAVLCREIGATEESISRALEGLHKKGVVRHEGPLWAMA